MVEDVEADPLLNDRKHGHCRRASDEKLDQVLDRAPVANERDEQVVNEYEAEEESDRLQYRRSERSDPSNIHRE